METLIEQIQVAVASDATDEARAAGAQACRTILAALEATPGEALASPAAAPQAPTAQPHIPAEVVRAAVTALRGMPVEQLLDLAISRLRAALPPGADVAPIKPPAFQLVPVPTLSARK
jgi:hypothetical protein